jgi:uncharacterized protein with NRDE domain
MCLLAVLWRTTAGAPLVVAANREEDYARGGEPPRRLGGGVVAGVDPAQGGTWLGVNRHGVLVAVTNRRKSVLPPAPRSRGLLARDLLALPSAAEAVTEAVRQLERGAYAGCNFLCADGRDALVVHAGDWLRVRPLPPGVHVLSNADVNDPSDPRVRYALGWLAGRPLSAAEEALPALETLCASHEPTGHPVCFRGETRGTVSGSLLALRPDLSGSTYLHAQGPPDRTPYVDVSGLLRGL